MNINTGNTGNRKRSCL